MLTELQKSLRKEWCDALRHGDYAQGKHALRRDGLDSFRFCCLGVVCDLEDKRENEFSCWDKNCYKGLNTTLPKALIVTLGLKLDQISKLIQMNDSGANFFEIADVIDGFTARDGAKQ